MVPRPKQQVKAKCEANQVALDRLIEKRIQIGPSSNYQYTLKRAIDSLAAHQEPITSYQQALQLKYVGSHCALIICPPTKQQQQQQQKTKRGDAAAGSGTETASTTINTSASVPKRRKRHDDIAISKTKSTTNPLITTTSIAAAANSGKENNDQVHDYASADDSETDDHDMLARAKPTKKQKSTTTKRSKFQQLQLDGSLAIDKSKNSSECNPLILLDQPTAKEIAHMKAVQEAESTSFMNQGLHWRVVLIIDGREQKSEHIQAKCQMSGIPCEERMLPIGDMAWIAQGYHNHNHRGGAAPVTEIMLGTIIERKSTEDLKSSLFGTRYLEQRLRLQHSGLPQILFLIEGDLNKEQYRCPADTLHSAVWETRIHLGFNIIQTSHMDETVITLKRMHRRILQRTFPSAFIDESLPTFQEADARARQQQHQHQQQRRDIDVSSIDIPTRRRRRRRIQSLMEMTFDTDPIPPLGTNRFITYKELKTKIERDREAGTRTVGSIHRAMLKQVATFSAVKCHAVARIYPTMNQLMKLYYINNNSPSQQQNYVSSISILDPNASSSGQSRTIGPRSSAELYIAYGMVDGDNDQMNAVHSSVGSYENRTPETQYQSKKQGLSYPKLVEQLRNKNNNVQQTKNKASSSATTSDFWTGLNHDNDEMIMRMNGPTTSTNNTKQNNNSNRATSLARISESVLSSQSTSSSNKSDFFENQCSVSCTKTNETVYSVLKENNTSKKVKTIHTKSDRSGFASSDYGFVHSPFHEDPMHIFATKNSPAWLDLTAETPDRKNPTKTKTKILSNSIDLSLDDQSYIQDLSQNMNRSDQDSTISTYKKKRTSQGSKKSFRSSTSSGFYTTDDDLPLEQLKQKKTTCTETSTPVFSQRSDPVAQKELFSLNSTNRGDDIYEPKSKAPLLPSDKSAPSSLLKSLHEALLSSSDDEDEDDKQAIHFDFADTKRIAWQNAMSTCNNSMNGSDPLDIYTSKTESTIKKDRKSFRTEIIEIDD